MPHSRQPSHAASVASSNTSSWTSAEYSSDGEGTSTMSGRSRSSSLIVNGGGSPTGAREPDRTLAGQPAEGAGCAAAGAAGGKVLTPEERRENAERIIQSLAVTPATFLLQKEGENGQDGAASAKAHIDQAPVETKQLSNHRSEQPSASFAHPHHQPVPVTPSRARGRSEVAHDSMFSPGSSNDTKDAQSTAVKVGAATRPRTVSSPPSMRRSRSTPRPSHIPMAPHHRAPNTAQPRRLPTADRIEKAIRSAVDPQHGVKASHTSTPLQSIPTPNLTNIQKPPPEKSSSQKLSGPFPQLPIQTYLHLALASPQSTAVSQPAPAPPPILEMKYPYVPSDSPDLILERITNFFFLPPFLEKVLFFGMLACLDSWLYTFTILPLRFGRALGLLMSYWISAVSVFWKGGNRLRKRRPSEVDILHDSTASTPTRRQGGQKTRRRERESRISDLQPQHKADLLKGAVVIITCFFLERFNASIMYHSIRGQAVFKLYVIYNVLEVYRGKPY